MCIHSRERIFALMLLTLAGCATVPPPVGKYQCGTSELEIGPEGKISYSGAVQRARGTCRVLGGDVIAAVVEIEEMKLSVTGSERSTEWVARGDTPLFFCVDKENRTFKRFRRAETAKRYSAFLEQQDTCCLVEGMVTIPGPQECPTPLPLTQVILRAGGILEDASPKDVGITRGDTKRVVDLAAITKQNADDVLVQAGDIVIVPGCDGSPIDWPDP